jgi:hypothetical protein
MRISRWLKARMGFSEGRTDEVMLHGTSKNFSTPEGVMSFIKISGNGSNAS